MIFLDIGESRGYRKAVVPRPEIVGEMGGGARHQLFALGETPNLAARLQSLAGRIADAAPLLTQAMEMTFWLPQAEAVLA